METNNRMTLDEQLALKTAQALAQADLVKQNAVANLAADLIDGPFVENDWRTALGLGGVTSASNRESYKRESGASGAKPRGGRLTYVEMKHLRGATTSTRIEFDFSKPLTLLYGENGTGKTSLLDAIEVGCGANGDALDSRPKNVSLETYLPTRGYSASDIRLHIYCTDGIDETVRQWNGTLQDGRVNQLMGAGITTYLLRRQEIANLLEAEPRNRYPMIAAFVDTPQMKAAEPFLAQAYEQAKDALQNQQRAISTACDVFEPLLLLATNGQPLPLIKVKGDKYEKRANTLLTQAKPIVESGTSNGAGNVKELGEAAVALLSQWQKVRDLQAQLPRSEEAVQNAVAQVHQCEHDLQHARTELEALLWANASMTDPIPAGKPTEESVDEALFHLLERAKEYLTAKPNADSCPLCTQTLQVSHNATTLCAQIEQRLQDMSNVRERIGHRANEQEIRTRAVAYADHQLAEAQRKHEQAEATLNQCRSDSTHEGRQLARLAREYTGKLQTPGVIDWNEYALLFEETSGFALILELLNALVDVLAHAQPGLQAARERAINFIKWAEQLKPVYDKTETALEGYRQALRQEEVLKKAFDTVKSERNRFVDELLQDLGDECNRLYRFIHPHENLGFGAVRFDKKSKLGGATLHAQFEAQEVIAQTYFSESHLDTLGFCFWLALRTKYGEPGALIALDDVFQSVDDEHSERLLELLVEEAQRTKQQFILATHHKPWRDSAKQNANIGLVELAPWSKATGIQVQAA